MATSVYPETFFNLPSPASPTVSIQFRTNIKPNDDISDSSHWETITFNPNNFLNNITLEDSGGVYNLRLSLFDKNFAHIENVVTKCLAATRLANKLVDNPDHIEDSEYFQFFVSKSNSTNLRVRFGYSESLDDSFINASSLDSSDWINRTDNNKTVIMTPWLYFQIIKTDFKFSSRGLELELEAFSIMSHFLEQAKLVEVFARLYGSPKYVLENLCNRIKRAAEINGDKVTCEIRNEPRGHYSQEDGEEIIEVMLGGEPAFDSDGKFITRYKSLKRILDEACSNVRPIKYNKNGDKISYPDDRGSDAEGDKKENEEVDQIYRYSYFIQEHEDETKIIFYYQNPRKGLETQGNVRSYVWLQEGKSIVKELDINTETDFATLNLPIVNINRSSGEITCQIARGRSDNESDEDKNDFSVGRIEDFSEALSDQNFNGMFVRHMESIEGDSITSNKLSAAQLGNKISASIVENLNRQLFQGRIKLFGDPFYLFDENVQPFSYIIRIIVNRPNYVDKEGNFVAGGKSYLSGYYAIKKITHSISLSGFETELEVMKFNSLGR